MFYRGQEARAAVSQTHTFPAPSSGWVQSGNIATADLTQCERLDNIFPTAQSGRLRGGKVKIGDAQSSVARLFTYASGTAEQLFAATATAIYDANNIAGGALRSSTTSGDWSVAQITTAGGQFLGGVNGENTGWAYNGSTFSDLSITGVSSNTLSQMWLFKKRWFFVERNSTKIRYLPVESIGGAAQSFEVGSVFPEGGRIMFGATWSLDSGEGIDDVCALVSSEGEVAIYVGLSPSDWTLRGVYTIGKPLNKHAHFKAGADLVILTEDGLIPLSEALRKERAALQFSSLTYPIEDAWQNIIRNRLTSYPITATLWQSGTFLIIGTPTKYRNRQVSLVANARTGAWSRFTGWDVRCAAVYNDNLYFADSNGKIYQADTGGTDAGMAYTGVWVPKFKASNNISSVNAVGVTYRCTSEVDFNLEAHSDYEISELLEPVTTLADAGTTWGGGAQWGDGSIWGKSDLSSFTEWQTAYASGYAFAPSLAITSNQVEAIDFELLLSRVRTETGYAI